MIRIFRWYSRVLQIHPWKTQLITTGILMASSDLIAQSAIEKCKIQEIELSRIGRFAALGTFFVAPVLCTWYNVLENKIGTLGKTVGLRKMLMDQILFCPCFLWCFLIVSGILQFQSWQIIKRKINEDYSTILKTNYMLWPAAQLITFYVIPHQYRIIFVSSVALIWNTYLAAQANKSYKFADI